MSHAALVQQLGLLQEITRSMVEGLDDHACRNQYHPDLSPAGWHLGHCVYTECYWLYEVVEGNRQHTAAIEELYNPAQTPKSERGKQLPTQHQLLLWATQTQLNNLQYLNELNGSAACHKLHKDDYLLQFLIQHYCQHYENILMVLHQKTLAEEPVLTVNQPIAPHPPSTHTEMVRGGHYRIGGHKPVSYDNELPPQQADLGAFNIQVHPVSNAAYLGFMAADGYLKPEFWSDRGWAWQELNNTPRPDAWRQDENGNWFGIGLRGTYELLADEPVSGVSFYEAQAYAQWAGGRLPHEYQWETARRLQVIQNSGRAWEWCENSFHPYDGFQAFPYEEYSSAWFDGHHQTLRGGSMYTQAFVRRPSFRNFHTPEKRHIFAGLRLVF